MFSVVRQWKYTVHIVHLHVLHKAISDIVFWTIDILPVLTFQVHQHPVLIILNIQVQRGERKKKK